MDSSGAGSGDSKGGFIVFQTEGYFTLTLHARQLADASEHEYSSAHDDGTGKALAGMTWGFTYSLVSVGSHDSARVYRDGSGLLRAWVWPLDFTQAA